jgi:type IV pilus assembly protein PilF
MNKISYILVVFLIASCSTFSGKEKDKQANIYFSYGTDFLAEGKYSQAIKNFLQSMTLNHKNSKLHNNLGMAYFFKKKFKKAEAHFLESLEINENNDARNNLASLYMLENKINKSEKLYRLILNDITYAEQYRVLYNLSLIEKKRGNIKKMEKYLLNSIKENSNYCPSYYEMSKLYLKKKNNKKRLKYLANSLVGHCYKNPKIHFELAQLYFKMSDIKASYFKFNDVVKKFPNSKYALWSTRKKKRIKTMYPNEVLGLNVDKKIKINQSDKL